MWRVLSRKWSDVVCVPCGGPVAASRAVYEGRAAEVGGAFHMVHREMEVGRQGPGEKWRAELRR